MAGNDDSASTTCDDVPVCDGPHCDGPHGDGAHCDDVLECDERFVRAAAGGASLLVAADDFLYFGFITAYFGFITGFITAYFCGVSSRN